jgi:hypothetical protein
MVDVDTSMPFNLEQRFRNIEAHLGIGSTDEETGKYNAEVHESLVPPEPDVAPMPAPGNLAAPPAPPKTVAELEQELAEAHAREGTGEGS